MINPTLLVLNDENMFSYNEGCLSIPGVFENRSRPSEIEISFTHIDGEFTQSYKASGLEAFVIQHEYDHLMGKLFINDWSRVKLERARKKVKKTRAL